MQGIQIKTIGSDYAKNFISKKENDKLVVEGIFPEIFYELAKKLNFTYKINISKDGTWSGMVKDLQNERFDMGNFQ